MFDTEITKIRKCLQPVLAQKNQKNKLPLRKPTICKIPKKNPKFQKKENNASGNENLRDENSKIEPNHKISRQP